MGRFAPPCSIVVPSGSAVSGKSSFCDDPLSSESSFCDGPTRPGGEAARRKIFAFVEEALSMGRFALPCS